MQASISNRGAELDCRFFFPQWCQRIFAMKDNVRDLLWKFVVQVAAMTPVCNTESSGQLTIRRSLQLLGLEKLHFDRS